MFLVLCHDIPQETGIVCLKLYDAHRSDEIIYQAFYRTQAERLLAARRAQRLCCNNGWQINQFLDGTEFNANKSQLRNRIKC